MGASLQLTILKDNFGIVKLKPSSVLPHWLNFPKQEFCYITSTSKELSLVIKEDQIPEGELADFGWKAIQVNGSADFPIMSHIVLCLAEANIRTRNISTYHTGFFLVQGTDLAKAKKVLEENNHYFTCNA